MFYYIEGKLAHLDYTFAVLDAQGVGYKMTITQTTYESMPPHLSVSEAPTVRLYTYMAVREDGIELFGFASEAELEAFKLLISVSGVGPKAALAILSVLSPDGFAVAVASGDAKAITRAKGIGPKAAQRIILELRDKISNDSVSKGFSSEPSVSVGRIGGSAGEAIAAMVSLGYTNSEAAAVIGKLDQSLPVDEMIKAALKAIAMKR